MAFADDPMCRACVETTLGTRLLIIAPLSTTIADFRGRIEGVHTRTFPENGEVVVKTIMILVSGFWYVVSEGFLGVVVQGTDAHFRVDLELPLAPSSGEVEIELQLPGGDVSEPEPKRQRTDGGGSLVNGGGEGTSSPAAHADDAGATASGAAATAAATQMVDFNVDQPAKVDSNVAKNSAATATPEKAANVDDSEAAKQHLLSVEMVPSTPLHTLDQAAENLATATAAAAEQTQILSTQIIGTPTQIPEEECPPTQVLTQILEVPSQVLENPVKSARLFAVRKLRL